jgi:hypothetical protein
MSNGVMTLNPNQPLPPILSSNLCTPPVWPLPNANWVVLPVVPVGFPQGPFPPAVITNPGTGLWPGPSICPGSGIGGRQNPASAISAVTVTSGGSGYTTASVTVSSLTGSGAVLTPVISGGVITGISVVNGGSGYLPTDSVTITGDGTGATASLVVPLMAPLALDYAAGAYDRPSPRGRYRRQALTRRDDA